mmetsp:Transcript_16760/g.43176  ORF Transcript_16760/g.43176 Transcript_16760/m.43176 type:complete len:323 (+) Transcript_16760:171-1139(+)
MHNNFFSFMFEFIVEIKPGPCLRSVATDSETSLAVAIAIASKLVWGHPGINTNSQAVMFEDVLAGALISFAEHVKELAVGCEIHLERFADRKSCTPASKDAKRRLLEAHRGMKDEAKVNKFLQTMKRPDWGLDWNNFGVWLENNPVAKWMVFEKCFSTRSDIAGFLFAFSENNVSETSQRRLKEDGRRQGDIISVLSAARDMDEGDAKNMDRDKTRMPTRCDPQWRTEAKGSKRKAKKSGKGQLFAGGDEGAKAPKTKKAATKILTKRQKNAGVQAAASVDGMSSAQMLRRDERRDTELRAMQASIELIRQMLEKDRQDKEK